MKNKILATIKDSQQDINAYLDYIAKLSSDFNLEVDIIPAELNIENISRPSAIIGQGIQPLKKSKSSEEIQVRQFKNFVNEAVNERYDENAYDIINNEKAQEDFLLWTINQTSNASFFNKLFGTTETELSKRTILPSLTLPEDCTYKKPETLLVVVRDTPNLDLSHLRALSKHMGLRIVFAYHEDEEEISIKNIMESMQVSFSEFVGSFRSFSVNNTDEMLDKITEYEKPEWIAYANYDRTPLERLYKINTNQLILSTELPVLNF